MTPIELRHKCAAVEADLVSAAAWGEQALYGVLAQKVAELDLSADDIEAVMQMCAGERKVADAEPSNWGRRAVQGLTLASLAAGPTLAAAKFVHGKLRKDRAFSDLQMTAPELFQQDPVRAKAMFDLLHTSSPEIATNVPVAADLMRQMMAAPMVDLGTTKNLSDMAKNFTQARREGPFGSTSSALGQVASNINSAKAVSDVFGKTSALIGKPDLVVPVRHISQDGVPCFFDWSTDAMKQAGITDAFSGNGTVSDQANNYTNMQMEAMGTDMLPLDSVVRELLAKEQELAQREEIIAQQEAQLQQAMGMVQQFQGAYQGQYGVDPMTGQPAAPAADGMGGGDDQAAAPQGAPDDTQGAQPGLGAGAAPGAADPAQDPVGPADPSQVPGAAAAGGDADPSQLPPGPGAGAPPLPAGGADIDPTQDPGAGEAPDQDQDAGAGGDPTAAADGDGDDPTAAPAAGDPAMAGAGAPPPDMGADPAAADAAGAGADAAGAAPAAPVSAAQMGSGGDIIVPLPSLRISVKLAELAGQDRRAAAHALYNTTVADLFRP